MQLIDARDLAGWMLRAAEERRTGAYSATGPAHELTTRGMPEGIREATNSDAGFVWASEKFILDAGVQPWEELPFWVPEEVAGILSVSVDKALGAGLAFRPLAETVRGTLDRGSSGAEIEAGVARDRERGLLRAWRGSNL